jgi:hypothetical protein
LAAPVLAGLDQAGPGWPGETMVTGSVIASPVDGKDDVRLRGQKAGLKGRTGAKEGGISAPPTPDRPDPREAQGVCTGEKRGRKVHNRPGSFNNALKRTASHKLVIERVSTGDCRGLRSRV